MTNGTSERKRKNNEGEILIVGGSLSGLTCALACVRYGVRTGYWKGWRCVTEQVAVLGLTGQTAEAAIVVTVDGTEIRAPVILRADGYRSIVRRPFR
jgi:2-polyprenyl-6-methoxyphenol hydroxylase-like FAD-dependent oxidoreductase